MLLINDKLYENLSIVSRVESTLIKHICGKAILKHSSFQYTKEASVKQENETESIIIGNEMV